jgi:hypothetical protein
MILFKCLNYLTLLWLVQSLTGDDSDCISLHGYIELEYDGNCYLQKMLAIAHEGMLNGTYGTSQAQVWFLRSV